MASSNASQTPGDNGLPVVFQAPQGNSTGTPRTLKKRAKEFVFTWMDRLKTLINPVSSFGATSILKVIVGEEPSQETFLVHEGIICERSEFFRRAMNGNWTESTERMIKLPDDSAETFGTYMNLVYTGKVATQLNDTDEKPKNEQLADECYCLCQLYVLAEKLQDASAKTSVIDALRYLIHEKNGLGQRKLPPPDAIKLLYEGTCKGDPARRLFVRCFVRANLELLEGATSTAPQEFLAELAIAALTGWRKTLASQE